MPTSVGTAQRQGGGRLVAAVIIGSALEWYDFFLYSTAAAIVFAKLFFPNIDPVAGTLAAFATYAVGFAARPFGGILFASIGDRFGRKHALIGTLVVMGVATAAIGVLPTHGQVGLWAAALLIVVRIVQALGAGAEFATASVFAVESVEPRKRGLYGSLPSIGVYLGLALATGAVTIASKTTGQAFLTWGWRLPFLFSLVLLAVALYIRMRFTETPEFQHAAAHQAPSRRPVLETLRSDWRGVLTVFGAQAAQAGVGYIYLAFALYYLSTTLKLGAQAGLEASLLTAVVAIATTPCFGWLSDRLGRRPVYLFGLIFSGCFAFVFFPMVDTKNSFLVDLAMVLATAIGVSAILAPQGALFSEMFPTRGRLSGFVLGRELSTALFGGFAPLVAIALLRSGTIYIAVLSAALCLVSLITLVVARSARTDRLPTSAGTVASEPAAELARTTPSAPSAERITL